MEVLVAISSNGRVDMTGATALSLSNSKSQLLIKVMKVVHIRIHNAPIEASSVA